MERAWKLLVVLRRSWLVRGGIISVLLKFIPDIRDWFEMFVFVRGGWGVVIDFLGSGYGTLTTVGLGFVLIVFAIYRASRKPEVSFPKELYATYGDVQFELYGVEDKISFIFEVVNDTPHELGLTGKNNGDLLFRDGLGSSFLAPWYVHLPDNSKSIKPKSTTNVTITRILEFGLAVEFAYKDPSLTKEKLPVTLSFANMTIEIKSIRKRGDTQYGVICLPGDTEVNVPENHIHWKRYRTMNENLKRGLI